MKIAALILAAGRSTRFGADDKLTQDYNGKPLIISVFNALKQSSCAELFCIIPKASHHLEALCQSHNIMPLFNNDPMAGQGRSLAIGLSALAGRGYDGVIIALGDMPNITPQHFDEVLDKASPKRAVFSENRNILMPPCFIPNPYFDHLKGLTGDQGARTVIGKDGEIARVSLSDFAARDIDKPQDLKAL